ncbi:cytidine deaminase [Nocardia sp. Marseille-Q1738]
MIERERRFRISAKTKKQIDEAFPTSAPIRIIDVTFGPDGSRSMDTVGWIVRVRTEGRNTRMEYKRRIDDETWEEVGIAVDSANAAASILQKTGLTPGLLISRDRYRVDQDFGTLVIDDVDDLGLFLEIELGSSDTDFPSVVEKLAAKDIYLGEAAPPYGDQILQRSAESDEYAALLDCRLQSFLQERGQVDPTPQQQHVSRPDHEVDALFRRAQENRANSYARYSEYPVGAVVTTSLGQVFDGCSVENGSFGLTLCAERSALSAAIAGGFDPGSGVRIEQVVVAGPDGASCPPCGACRQWISELADGSVVSFWWEGELVSVAASALTPFTFTYAPPNG